MTKPPPETIDFYLKASARFRLATKSQKEKKRTGQTAASEPPEVNSICGCFQRPISVRNPPADGSAIYCDDTALPDFCRLLLLSRRFLCRCARQPKAMWVSMETTGKYSTHQPTPPPPPRPSTRCRCVAGLDARLKSRRVSMGVQ